MAGKTSTADDIITAVQEGLNFLLSYVGQQAEWFPVTEMQIFLNNISTGPVTDSLTEGNLN